MIRNQHHSAEKQQWGDEEKWEMKEEKKNKIGQRRLERAVEESLISSRSFYGRAKRRGRENNKYEAAVLRSE